MAAKLIRDGQPMLLTFRELLEATADIHLHQKAHVDRLHDVWKQGAPTPNSIIRNPKDYDERKKQLGNFESRLVLPTPLAKWAVEVTKVRGMPWTFSQALEIVSGEESYRV